MSEEDYTSASTEVDRLLRHIAEECAKEQYWNALSWAHELAGYLMRRFDEVLKSPTGGR
jgi:hypothetical protein